MAFIKELVSKADEKLYLSFEMYDYDGKTISGLKLYTNWVIDRQREIYFTYVSGGSNEHPRQFDLIWKNKKIVIFVEKNVGRKPLMNNPSHMICLYNIISIRAPREFMSQQIEMINLIKEALTVNHSIDFIRGIPYENKNSMIITNIATPEYYDVVR